MHPLLDPEFAAKLLSEAAEDDDKYSRGFVGFVTGSERYPGAALLGIEAAYELQIGMVGYQGPKSVSELVLANRPETLLDISRANALVVGSGISESETGEQKSNLLALATRGTPLVVDAGALQIIDFQSVDQPCVLTPHAGEAERLLARHGVECKREDIEASPLDFAVLLAKLTNQVVLLKGNLSILALAEHETIQSGPGSTFLATAGTGDVLAGMIGALAAKYLAKNGQFNKQVFRHLALLAVQLHSEAAEIAASQGNYGASAICSAISEAVRT